MRRWRISITLAIAALLLVGLAAFVVVAQAGGTKYYDGTCGEDLNHAYCYGGYAGVDFAAPVSLKEVFTPTLPVVTIRVAANGYLLDRTLALLLMDGSSAIASWGLDVKAGQTIVFEVEASGLYAKSYSLVVSGGGPSWVEWIEVGPVEGGYSEPEPEPPPAIPCINDDPDLESGGADWINIGDPEWLTTTVRLDQYEGIAQPVYLLPGAYEIQVGAVTDEHAQTTPITVSLGITGTEQHVLMLGGAIVSIAVTEEGPYTLTVVSDFAHPEELLELTWVCLQAKTCVNRDPYIVYDDLYWGQIGIPDFLTASNGVKLGYQDGLIQNVALAAGAYQFEAILADVISDTIPYIWLGADTAGSAIKADLSVTVTWDFIVSNSGTYQINAKNPANTPPITVTYLCVYPIEKELCTFSDHTMTTGAGWETTGEAQFQDGRAVLGCGGYIEQIAYLNKGSYVISVTVDADFLVSGSGFNPYNEGGDLTIYWEGEYQSIGGVNIPIAGGLYDGMETYTATIAIPLSGYYRFLFWNRDNCYNRGGLWAEKKTGTVTIDEICLIQDIDQIGIGMGDCRFVQDSSMAGWGWNEAGPVSWSGTTVELAQGGSISQSINISTTEAITQLIAYVVARAPSGSQVFVSLTDSYTFTISQTVESDFVVLTTTLGYSRPTDYVLTSVSGGVEIDFTCLYRIGEVPDGPWQPGADGDPVCIKPLEFDWSSLTWDLIESVSRILRFIWEWIVFFWCEVTMWLSRIWFKLGRWVSQMTIDLGDWLTDLRIDVMNWPLVVIAFDILLFIPWVLNRFWQLIGRILSPILWAAAFIFTLIPALFTQIGDPTPVESLSLGEFEQGFLFVQNIANSTPLTALIVLVNAILWLVFIVWAIRQFSESNT